MIAELYKSPRFKEDVQRYNLAITKLEEGTTKEEATVLLGKLVSEVKKMDSMYMDMVYNKQLGSLGNDFRENIKTIRKQLEEKLFKNSKEIK